MVSRYLDQVADFLERETTPDAGASVPTADLHRAFCAWRSRNRKGGRPPSVYGLGKHLSTLGVATAKGPDGERQRVGLRLRGRAEKAMSGEWTPPGHLDASTQAWGRFLYEEYEVEGAATMLLEALLEAWERKEQARAILDRSGLTYQDRFGQPRPRPEVAIERDSRLHVARIARELGVAEAEEPRPPQRPSSPPQRRRP